MLPPRRPDNASMPFRLPTRRRLAALLTAAALGGCTAPAPKPPADARPDAPLADDAATRQAFVRWLDGLRADARAAGIDDATLHAALDGVQLLPRVVELDRAQPEFTRSVRDYLVATVTPARVVRGQERLREAQAAAEPAAARYGVPAPVLAAIWGIESNFGGNVGDIPTIDALATLGFEGRRADWARGQLIAALKILQRGDITRAGMVGSWAGAMGQTQFLPSNVLAYAVDADGDGRHDLWNSLPDVFASTAHFLARSGWQRGQPWGAEVRLPPGFDVGRADGQRRQAAAAWAAEGVQGVDGAPLPALDDTALLLPAGARGPAFLVGPNFRTILRYNNATSYALAVALLAQQIDGGPGVQAAWPADLVTLSRTEVRALQQALDDRGFATGTPDGVMGPATREGLRRWQRSAGLPPDGEPDAAQLRTLGVR